MMLGCGGYFTQSTNEFTSPNYPNPYPHRRVCVWRIEVATGQAIELTIHDFDLETHSECRFDVLEVLAEHSNDSGILRTNPNYYRFRKHFINIVILLCLKLVLTKTDECENYFNYAFLTTYSHGFVCKKTWYIISCTCLSKFHVFFNSTLRCTVVVICRHQDWFNCVTSRRQRRFWRPPEISCTSFSVVTSA